MFLALLFAATTTTRIDVSHLPCGGAARALAERIRKKDGVSDARLEKRELVVTYDDARITKEQLPL